MGKVYQVIVELEAADDATEDEVSAELLECIAGLQETFSHDPRSIEDIYVKEGTLLEIPEEAL